MSGFFTIKETESKDRPGGKKYSCISCGCYKNCTTPRMQPYGNFKKKILVIGSYAEEIDDREGKPFQSRYGRYLERTLLKHDIDLFEDCLCMNACHCFITDEDSDTRTPTNYEVECCRKTTLKVIEDNKPHLILLLGNSALFSLVGHRWKKDLGDIEKWRGWTISDQDFKCWICPVMDPKEVEQSKKEEIKTIWEQDIKRTVSMLQESIRIYKEPNIEILAEEDLQVLSTLRNDFAFDYETTGLKPHAEGHQIVCASIAVNADFAYVFMMPTSRKARQPFIELLKNPKIGKIAQNMKFEHTWSLIRLKTEVQNWVWDTMLATHILDNRPGVTGLKFQTYVQFGIIDYASEVSSFLSATDNTNANNINNIMKLVEQSGGKEKLMKYCALDSIYEYRLSMIQRSIIELPF